MREFPTSRSRPREANILKRAFERWLTSRWYSATPILWLKPLSHLYHGLARRRREAHDAGERPVTALPVPVIVVGNLIAGGAGKTPAVAAIVDVLKKAHWHPGIILRGYGADDDEPHVLNAESVSSEVGDEALLHYRALRVPVAVGRDRAEVGARLLERHPDIDCLVSDDGLQHYGLARDLELVVIDRERGFGNEALIPAGPLREPLSRLDEVDALLIHPESQAQHAHRAPAIPRLEMTTTMLPPRPFEDWWSGDRSLHSSWAQWSQDRVHAVAGIAYPERFFKGLEALGLEVIAHPFPDHYAFTPQDLVFTETHPVLMTEKDAVKCGGYDLDRHWVVPLKSELSPEAAQWLIQSLERIDGRKAS